jgi:hypothetical protein
MIEGEGYEPARLGLILDRMAATTLKSYNSQFRWWELYCLRRGVPPMRYNTQYDRAEEDMMLDFIILSGLNVQRAPGTVKMRLAAIRNRHLSMGFPDPMAFMPRVPLAMAGLKRRYGTKERRHPVTPEMLRWLRANLRPRELANDAVIWAAVALGFFFLLRASEYLDVGYRAPNRGLLGRNVELRLRGQVKELKDLTHADEVVLKIRGSKTDTYNRGETRNHFQVETSEEARSRNLPAVCVVSAVRMLFSHFPLRYLGSAEENEPLLRYSSGVAVTRMEVQGMLGRAAVALGHSDHHFGSHSLRFGGGLSYLGCVP